MLTRRRALAVCLAVDSKEGLIERLKLALDQTPLKQYEVEEAGSLSKGLVSSLLSGRRGKAPTDDMMRRLSQALGVRQEWLARGEGPMRPNALTDPPFLKNRPEWSAVLAESIRRHRTIPAKIFYDLGDAIIPGLPRTLDWQVVGNIGRDVCDAILREGDSPASATEIFDERGEDDVG